MSATLTLTTWTTLTLDDVVPMWGEGKTRADAVADLVASVRALKGDLIANRDRLAPGLREQLDFLEAISR